MDLTITNQLSNLVSQVVGVDLIGKLSDHQALASVDFLHVDNRALGDGTASRTVCVFNSATSQNRCTRWEVGAGDQLEEGLKEFLSRGLGVLKRPLHATRNLTQVVRGDAGRHTDGDTFRTIHQDVGETRGKNGRFLVAAIVVVLEINAFFVDVADHFHGQRGHLTFGVTRCCGAQVTGGTEVTLTGDQGVAQRPGLHQARKCIVDRCVAVGVVVTHDVTDDAR